MYTPPAFRVDDPAWIHGFVEAHDFGLLVCAGLTLAGVRILLASKAGGNLVIKTLEFPEWYLLAPVPVTFALLAIEFVFRMYRLHQMAGVLRDDVTSVA